MRIETYKPKKKVISQSPKKMAQKIEKEAGSAYTGGGKMKKEVSRATEESR